MSSIAGLIGEPRTLGLRAVAPCARVVPHHSHGAAARKAHKRCDGIKRLNGIEEMPMSGQGEQALATLGGGCFWCLEAVYKELKGVERVVSGYAGGTLENPTYEQVCSGHTGHAEVVQITYDAKVISFRDLLDVFFTIHDPTTKDRQGADIGPQYRSIILYHSPEQKADAERAIADVTEKKIWRAPIVTEVVPLEKFYPAEDYHQDYFELNPRQRYCQIVIAPKVAKFRKEHLARLKR
jgi:peptide-methionine (S)-S-oxide reductase